ncbi:MAG: hypothetical protein QOF89_160 [Acidobacteriota bacterium]|nr:hypothetical protein [Acidobacteriota bacterium]
MSEDRCPDCGAAVPGGRAGCQALMDEIQARAYGDLEVAANRDLAFDAYCMQHPERYCHSAKSYAAHLTRLCCGVEHGGNPRVYEAIQRWLNGSPPLEKPEIPRHLGQRTVKDLESAAGEHARLVRDWAGSVWEAYAAQHELARGWIQAALSAQERTARKR